MPIYPPTMAHSITPTASTASAGSTRSFFPASGFVRSLPTAAPSPINRYAGSMTPAQAARLRDPASAGRHALATPSVAEVSAVRQSIDNTNALDNVRAAFRLALKQAVQSGQKADASAAQRDDVTAQQAKIRSVAHLERARMFGMQILRIKGTPIPRSLFAPSGAGITVAEAARHRPINRAGTFRFGHGLGGLGADSFARAAAQAANEVGAAVAGSGGFQGTAAGANFGGGGALGGTLGFSIDIGKGKIDTGIPVVNDLLGKGSDVGHQLLAPLVKDLCEQAAVAARGEASQQTASQIKSAGSDPTVSPFKETVKAAGDNAYNAAKRVCQQKKAGAAPSPIGVTTKPAGSGGAPAVAKSGTHIAVIGLGVFAAAKLGLFKGLLAAVGL